MRTIFITTFIALEVKNILRTGIVEKLLEDPNLRVVLLMKNDIRVEHFKKEFNHPRMVYEAVAAPKSKGLDAVFSGLKYTLLRTDTTIWRRKLLFTDDKNYLHYWSGAALNFIFANSFFRRIARALDYRLIKTDIYANLFDKYKPDLVFLGYLFDEEEIHLLREAKRRGVKTVGFINTWDRITARCILRLLPDKFVVFNDIVKEELILCDEAEEKNIFVAGLPQYDFYFNKKFSSKELFFERLGIDMSQKLFVYAPLGSSLTGSDWDAIDYLYSLNKAGKFGENIKILVRFQPNDFIDEAGLKKRPYLLYDYPGVRYARERGGDWDMTFDDLNHLHDTLRHMSLLICYASSLSVDAALLDKPVININFAVKNESPMRLPTRLYHLAHYKKALRTGGIRLVGDETELVSWVKKYLAEPALDREKRKILADEQCKFSDGKSAERISKFISSQI